MRSPNHITGVTPASFEPTLDYVVVKVPRFAFEKFPAADATPTTTMKSVGEAMAIGGHRIAEGAAVVPVGGGTARDLEDPDRRTHSRKGATIEQAFEGGRGHGSVVPRF